MNKTQKEQAVSALRGEFENAGSIVVTHYTGLTVGEITALRKKMKSLGANFKVTKNSLAKLALKGTKYDCLTDKFTGPTAIAISSDPVSASKGVVDFSNDNEKLVILCGAMQDQLIDADGVKTLAKLPSLDELRGKIIGLLNAPAVKIAGVLQAPAGQITRVINAHSQQEN